MTPAARFLACSAELLSFSLAGETTSPPVAPPDPATARTHAERIAKAWGREKPAHILLIGLGSGATAETLASMLPDTTDLIVCERDPGKVSALQQLGRLPAFGPRFGLIADTSAWTHLCLTAMHNIHSETAFITPNPELSPEEKPGCRELTALFRKSSPRAVPTTRSSTPSISFGAILSPNEPMLPDFLNQIPAWVHEAVFVWDAAEVPGLSLPEHLQGIEIRHIASPLEAGFDAQRNIMREACSGEWIFSLDGDELLRPEHWNLLPQLAAETGISGYHFPRSTFYPDRTRVRAGFGLWPDLQLRLFENSPSVRYVRPIHERLTGLPGRQGVALEPALEHYSHLVKSEQELEAKLERFDSASGGAVRHNLSREYPNIPKELLTPPDSGTEETPVILLPENVE